MVWLVLLPAPVPLLSIGPGTQKCSVLEKMVALPEKFRAPFDPEILLLGINANETCDTWSPELERAQCV